MTHTTKWSESDAIDAANELFFLANPLATSFDQVNPAQDTLARSVLGNSVFELINQHNIFHDNVYLNDMAPRLHDQAGAAVSTYLLSFFTDIRWRIGEGEPFSMLSRRISNHIPVYPVLRDGGVHSAGKVFISLHNSEQISDFLRCLHETGLDPINLAFNHSLQATLIALTKKPLSPHKLESLLSVSSEDFSLLHDFFDPVSLLDRELLWFGDMDFERQTTLKKLGLLDDLNTDERETFDVLAKDWNGKLNDLKQISVSLTRA